MLSTLQICLLAAEGVFALASIIFMLMFIIEITAKEKSESKKVSVKEVAQISKQVEETQISVDEMLENLEKEAAEDENKQVETVDASEIENAREEIKEENDEEIAEEVIEEVKEEVSEEVIENLTEEIVVEPSPEESAAAEVEEKTEEVSDEDDDSETDDDDIDEASYEKLEEIVIVPGTVIDYKARLEKVISGRAKIERDLTKIQKFILKYERTERRKDRNQKMLDRRAGELTNLNLVMYSVTDIKNVDEEKKVKQEELTAHIAELKASIQDAEEYLESNKEKYNHNVKMAKFLSQERVRYSEEIVELEALIKASDENK